MKVSELNHAIKNAQKILKKIREKYPQIFVYLVLTDKVGQAPITSSLEFLIEEMDHFFIENEALYDLWDLMEEIYDLNLEVRASRKNETQNLYLQNKLFSVKEQFTAQISEIEIKDDIEICLRWDEIDYGVNKELGQDNHLVDVKRSNTHIGGIDISLGVIGDLTQLNHDLYSN